jgi:hypothetical protein
MNNGSLTETGSLGNPFRDYHCNETFHLGKFRNLAAALVYTHARIISKKIGADKTRTFFARTKSVAEFLDLNPRTIRRGIIVLVKIGYFVPLETGRRNKAGNFTSNKYQVLGHREWAKKHPGECCLKKPQSESD